MPRLYLATSVVDDPSSLIALLPDLLQGLDIAAVLVRLALSDERTLTERAKLLASPIQNAGAAFLLEGYENIVARAGADGAHLESFDALKEALPVLKPDRIAGVGGLLTRHDAMSAGEAGADYVMFGDSDADGQRPPTEAIVERLQWWAELFEPPCVGAATTIDEVHAFANAGADFVLVGDLIWNDRRGPRAALLDIRDALGQNPDGIAGKTRADHASTMT